MMGTLCSPKLSKKPYQDYELMINETRLKNDLTYLFMENIN